MTSQNTKIKQLLDQIDVLLSKTPPRLPWVMAGDVDQQRKILEETRDYLRSLEPQLATRESYIAPPVLPGYGAPPADTGAAESAQQVLQGVLQEMNYLRSTVMQTMRNDIDALQQQRDALAQDVRFLEAQRQQYMVPQQQMNQQLISDFLQSLMSRLQENLTEQVAQMMMNLQLEGRGTPGLPGEPSPENALPGSTAYQGMLTPSQRLEHIQRVQAQSDQLLLKLDSTLKVIFDSLHQNLQGYEESLGQGLDKMHRLGQQGEAMFAALVNRLAQQLGRDASAYLQSSIDSSAWEATAPYLPSNLSSTQSEPTETVTESQIDYLLNQLNRSPGPDQTAPTTNLAIDLSQIELETDPPIFDLPEDNGQLTLFQNEAEEPVVADLPPVSVEEPAPLPAPETTDDLDAAFDLLNQYTDEVEKTRELEASLREEDTPVETPESLYDEVDLYESMFGPTADEGDQTTFLEPAPADLADIDEAAAPTAEDPPYATDEAFPNEFEDALFDGLADPAIEPELGVETSDGSDEISVATGSLFGETDADLEAEGWLEIQDDAPQTDGLLEVEPENTTDTISALTDLIPSEEGDRPDAAPEAGAIAEPVDEPVEESYEAAAPGEDLLEADQPIDSTPLDLALNSNTLSQLSADLSNLEGLEQDDWELSDFAVTAPPDEPAAGEAAPAEPVIPTLDPPTEEVLAEYFNSFEAAEDEFALPQEPAPQDEVDLLFSDAPDLSNLLAEEPMDPAELESLQADDDELEVFSVDMEESDLSDEEALRALLDDEPDAPLFDAQPNEIANEDDELLAAVRNENIPQIDDMLAHPVEVDDPDALFSSVDAGIEALPNIYSPDDLPMPTAETDDGIDGGFDLEADFDAAIAQPSPGLPLDMSGDTAVQDLFGQPETDESSEPETGYGVESDVADAEPHSLTLDGFSDTFEGPEVASEANLDEYEVVGNSYASPSIDEPVADDGTLDDWFSGASIDELDPLDELDPEPDLAPTASPPTAPSSIDELFATETPDDLFETDALIEQALQEEDADAFTLDGLGSLFEDVPDYEPDVYPIPSPGNQNSINGSIPEGRFAESDPSNPSETSEKKSP